MSKTFSSKMSIFNNQKVSDHHAIIPTEVRQLVMSDLSNRELKLYGYDCRAFFRSFNASARV